MYEIKLRNVEISFYTQFERSLRSRVLKKKDVEKVVALKNINLEIKNNEKVAFVGHNGSGKTTLLKTISKIYDPINGDIEINGKVFSLIDVAMGLDEEATGLQNIYLIGIQNLISKDYIENNLTNIINFSELGDALYRDVRTYSSGMRMRLAVSIFINLKPEIFICDEFIAAGDSFFQKKFENQLASMIEKSCIFLLATHDPIVVKKYCSRKITLSNGEIIEDEKI